MRDRTRGAAPRCPFCGIELARPVEQELGPGERHPAGTCTCGALYLVDPTGKNVGTIMALAMNLTADRLGKTLIELVPGEDYEDMVLAYDWRNHRSSGESTGYMDGYGRLYVLKVLRTA